MADKFQWFKFTPADWMMGRIRKCPEITQARFITLCCLYWNKEGNLTIEDAIIEVDQEHYDTLLSKKVIKENGDNITIDFLDSQLEDVSIIRENASKAGKASAKKRKANDKRKSNDSSTPVEQKATDKTREEEIRREETREEKTEREEKKETSLSLEKNESKESKPGRVIHLTDPPRYQIPDKEIKPEPSTTKGFHPYLEEFSQKFNIPKPGYHGTDGTVQWVNQLLKKVDGEGQLDFFKKQVEFYFKLKEINGQGIAGWRGWFGLNEKPPLWTQEDYESAYLSLQSKQDFNKNHGTKERLTDEQKEYLASRRDI